MDRTALYVVFSGAGQEGSTKAFSWAEYPTLDALRTALTGINISVEMTADGSTPSRLLLQSAQGNPVLSSTPYTVHYMPEGSAVVPINDVRTSLQSLGEVSVQVLGEPSERRFMIRMEDSSLDTEGGVPAEKIISTLESTFGAGGVAVTRSDYVGARFSQTLARQAIYLSILTLLIILIYASIRFKPQFAIGAVLAIAHDALIMIAFFAWTQMQFNTTSIAALLTIIGYSINDTIVIFDRIRETRRLYPDDSFVDVLNRALSETLGRTIITSLTTMVAVLALVIFTDGDMRNFGIALIVGMTSGIYSTIYIASGFSNFWEKAKLKKVARTSK
jgi:preprotein translocase subunit SecF